MSSFVGVRPMGGLGNQLFIYAAGLSLARRYGVPLRIHTDWYATNRDRELELTAFQYSGQLVSSTIPIDKQLRSRPLPKLIKGQLARRNGTYLHEEAHHAFTPLQDLRPPVELRGYFQSWRYFCTVADELSSQMSQLVDPSPAVYRHLDELQKLGQWVAVHVRCGDFLDPALLGLHGKTQREYYERALSLLEDLRSPLPMVVFSDDPARARSLLDGLRPEMCFLPLDPEIRPMDWIYILSHASSVVTANSSYSWWVAWLAEQREAWPIICPRPWFADTSIPEQDLLPLSWIAVGREYR